MTIRVRPLPVVTMPLVAADGMPRSEGVTPVVRGYCNDRVSDLEGGVTRCVRLSTKSEVLALPFALPVFVCALCVRGKILVDRGAELFRVIRLGEKSVASGGDRALAVRRRR